MRRTLVPTSRRSAPVVVLVAAFGACIPVTEPADDDDDRRRRADDEAPACVTGEIGCLDDATAFVCSDDGSTREAVPCRDDQLCLDGVCRARVCTPDVATCAGNARVTCDATGTDETVEPCDGAGACVDDGLGCACSEGECLARTCEPGGARCVGNSAQPCRQDGLGHEDLQDCGGDSCYAGRCLADACTAGATLCSGRVLLTCDGDGLGYAETSCAQTCGGADGAAACTERVCAPFATRCLDDDTVEQCNGQGTAVAPVECGARQRCEAGACRDQLCEPNSRSCVGDSVRACNADGSAETVTACAETETCASGACVDEACVPACGGRTCGPDPTCGVSCGTCDGTCTAGGQCELPSGAVLTVELTSSPVVDLDLYVSRTGTACDADSCFFQNCESGDADRPDWDGSGAPSAGDPVLIPSSTSTAEVARVPLPSTAQTYTIGADNFSSQSSTTTATVRVKIDGTLVATHTRSLPPDTLWKGVVVSWSGTAATSNDNGTIVETFACSDPVGTQCTKDTDCPAGEACIDGGFLAVDTCGPGCRNDAECGALLACNAARDCVLAPTVVGWRAPCASNAECQAGFHCDFFTQVCEEECTPGCTPGTDCCERSGGDTCVADPILQIFGNCAP